MKIVLVQDTSVNKNNLLTINTEDVEISLIDVSSKTTKIFIKQKKASNNYNLIFGTNIIMKQENYNVKFSL
jgi:hypothetical protein